MYIIHCRQPWTLDTVLPCMRNPMTKQMSEWCCVAFSPMAEVDQCNGLSGQDNHLAALSSSHLCLIDYSGGWCAADPQRTVSIANNTRPTSISYTACGYWLGCGFEDGQLQIWNAFSLTMERTLCSHTGAINCLASSPRKAQYDPRFVSCGADQSMRVWHVNTWSMEEIVSDVRCDKAGVRSCSFSGTGNWLVSVGSQVSIWRVVVTPEARLFLELHQRLKAVCGAEGLRAAAFSVVDDTLAVGSRDGVLSLWTKFRGLPPDPVVQERLQTNAFAKCLERAAEAAVTKSKSDSLHSPSNMSKVSPDSMSMRRAQFLTGGRSPGHRPFDFRRLTAAASAGEAITGLAASRVDGGSLVDSQAVLDRSGSLPDIQRSSIPRSLQFEDIFGAYTGSSPSGSQPLAPSVARQQSVIFGMSDRPSPIDTNLRSVATTEETPSPVRRQRSFTSIQRIALAPKPIC
eukprot:gnl/TRDRNA2_/TRDRNA2_135833_c0_seq1.p1 gnl/TRDRNA2_/TRDRNA2_135833_c0~~gnl/TRDRNA2_/TRDRNA2_135833_c0_seq1.p1  ORF type:complete len:531 (-),score=52.35 gnl/TRDRNA2_/TRDRNA2_135833_c0_seq1:114-1487(-)